MKRCNLLALVAGLLLPTLASAAEVPAPGTLTYKTQYIRNVFAGHDYSYYRYYNWTYTDHLISHVFNGETFSDAHGGPTPPAEGGEGLTDQFTDANGFNIRLYINNVTQGYVTVDEQTGNLYPHFRIMKVDYAPPGRNSYVDYGDTTVAGSRTSSQDNWAAGISVGFTGSFFGNGGGFTITSTETTSRTDSLAINKAAGWNFQFFGGPTGLNAANDGLNHDNDVITLLLNPQVILTQQYGGNAGTSYGVDPSDANVSPGEMELTFVTVGQIKAWLADPGWTPSGPLARSWAGSGGAISKADLQQMLQADPFANDPSGSNTSVNGLVASGRYTAVGGQNIIYVPTSSGVTVQRYTASYQNISANETADKLEVKAEVKFTEGIGLSSWLGARGSQGFSYVWSHLNIEALSRDCKQQTTVSIQSPANDYPGPQSMVMFQDNLFGTIMFAPSPLH